MANTVRVKLGTKLVPTFEVEYEGEVYTLTKHITAGELANWIEPENGSYVVRNDSGDFRDNYIANGTFVLKSNNGPTPQATAPAQGSQQQSVTQSVSTSSDIARPTDNQFKASLKNPDELIKRLEGHKASGKKFRPKNDDEPNLMYRVCQQAPQLNWANKDATAKQLCSLLLDLGEDLETAGGWAVTPVFQAAKSGLLETLKFLVDRGADLKKEAWTNEVELDVPFRVNVLEYSMTRGNHSNDQIRDYLKSKGLSSTKMETGKSNVSKNQNLLTGLANNVKNLSYIPSKITTSNSDEAMAILKQMSEFVNKLSPELQEFFVKTLNVVHPEKTQELQIVNPKDFSRLLNQLRVESAKSSSLIANPEVYKLQEEYEDTSYYKLMAQFLASFLPQSFPGKPGRTIQSFIVKNLADPASKYLPSNMKRLETFTDYLAAVIFKIFMLIQNKQESFTELHKEVLEEYGPTSSKGKRREISGTVFSCAYIAAEFLEENVLAKDAALKHTVEEIYQEMKANVESIFDLEGEK